MNYLAEKLSPTATGMIRMDHTHVLATFHQYTLATAPRVKKGLVNTACVALEIHAQLEEEIFYPAVRAVDDSETSRKSVPEHDEMRRLIARLRAMEPEDTGYDEVFMELMRDVLHHVADEETVLLPQAERLLGDRLQELGGRMTRRRIELTAPRAGEIAINMARGMSATTLTVLGTAITGACLAAWYANANSPRRRA